MINEEWNKTQNNAPFVAFYDKRADTFLLPDEMADGPTKYHKDTLNTTKTHKDAQRHHKDSQRRTKATNTP